MVLDPRRADNSGNVAMFTRLLLCLATTTLLLAAVEKDPWGQDIPIHPWFGASWPMRHRICADYQAGIACLVPYGLLPRDQAVPSYSRMRPKTTWVDDGRSIDGRKAVKELTLMEWETEPAVRLLSEAAPAGPADMAAIGDRLAGAALTWKPYDYYANPDKRPFAAKEFAPDGIVAQLGEAKGRRALVLHHQDRCSVVVLSGELAAKAELLDQVQVMSRDRKGVASTWAEVQGAKGVCLGADRLPLTAKAKAARPPIAWKEGYSIETRHYQVTGNIPPGQLAKRARDLEALYAAYSTFFETEDDAPLKFEVHICDTWKAFQELSTACDRPLQVENGSVLGGFFVPMCQSLWIYEESGQLGGPSMAIEHVMSHECSHQFLHMACNGSDNVPTWINEGVAVYFENGVLAAGKYQHRFPVDRIKRLASIYRERRTTLQPMGIYLDHHGSIGADLYGEVFAMVHFWAFGQPGGRQRFHAFWKALRTGEDGLEAFNRIFMADMVKVAGSRQVALENWRKALTAYVLGELSKIR